MGQFYLGVSNRAVSNSNWHYTKFLWSYCYTIIYQMVSNDQVKSCYYNASLSENN